ncbi:MAG: hypothetical protein GX493_12345 [Firmicutes bacterium]|nr:hypothetical protein [Bacillota bacterium]
MRKGTRDKRPRDLVQAPQDLAFRRPRGGETAGKSADFVEEAPPAVRPLRVGAGNLLVHDYGRVDDAIVHGILRRRLDCFARFAAAIASRW